MTGVAFEEDIDETDERQLSEDINEDHECTDTYIGKDGTISNSIPIATGRVIPSFGNSSNNVVLPPIYSVVKPVDSFSLFMDDN